MLACWRRLVWLTGHPSLLRRVRMFTPTRLPGTPKLQPRRRYPACQRAGPRCSTVTSRGLSPSVTFVIIVAAGRAASPALLGLRSACTCAVSEHPVHLVRVADRDIAHQPYRRPPHPGGSWRYEQVPKVDGLCFP
jgi:hypothetical protein